MAFNILSFPFFSNNLLLTATVATMGCSSLPKSISRYDVRGALYDLTPYEPPPGGGYENRLDCLTAEEQRAEQLCEEERYMFLYKNEEDVVTNQGKLETNIRGTHNIT